MHNEPAPRHRRRIASAAALVIATSSLLLASCNDSSSPSAAPGKPTSTTPAGDDPTDVADLTEPASCTVSDEPLHLEHSVLGHTYGADLHRPSSGPQDERLPVVIDLHGVYSDGPTQAALSRFTELADRAGAGGDGFLVVEPTGQVGPIDGATGWEVAALEEPARDDAQYLTQLIDTLVSEHCAEASHVYLAGYSNGGFFAAEYACAHPDKIAAIATVAGFDHPHDCTPTVPVIALHGTEDPVVPWEEGGTSILVADQPLPALAEALARGAEPQFAESAAAAGCDPTPQRNTVTEDVTLSIWTGCKEGADHQLYEISGGGHTWPGAAEQPDGDLLGPTSPSIDATTTIWDFFRTR